MTREQIREIEDALAVELTACHQQFLLSLPPNFDRSTSWWVCSRRGEVFLTPADFIAANDGRINPADLTCTEWSDEDRESLFIIGGDGCGNYFFIDPDDDDPDVRLLSHDPPGVEDVLPTLAQWCESLWRALENPPPPPWWKRLRFWK